MDFNISQKFSIMMETQFGWDVIEHPVFLGNGEKAKGYKALTRSKYLQNIVLELKCNN